MATVYDVDNVEVFQEQDSVLSFEVPATGEIGIMTPGPQGEPGVKNVYVQELNPAVQYGWGPEQAGYIWIEVDV